MTSFINPNFNFIRGKINQATGRKRSKYAKKKQRRLDKFALQNKIRNVIGEALFKKQLYLNRIKFFNQVVIASYIVDFLFAPKMLIVEIDGAYHNDEKQKSRDDDRQLRLSRRGFHVLRFTDDDVKQHPQECIDKVMSFPDRWSWRSVMKEIRKSNRKFQKRCVKADEIRIPYHIKQFQQIRKNLGLKNNKEFDVTIK